MSVSIKSEYSSDDHSIATTTSICTDTIPGYIRVDTMVTIACDGIIESNHDPQGM